MLKVDTVLGPFKINKSEINFQWKVELIFSVVKTLPVTTYHSLHHLGPLLPDPANDSRNIHYILFYNLLQNMVYGDECTSTTYSSTEREGTYSVKLSQHNMYFE